MSVREWAGAEERAGAIGLRSESRALGTRARMGGMYRARGAVGSGGRERRPGRADESGRPCARRGSMWVRRARGAAGARLERRSGPPRELMGAHPPPAAVQAPHDAFARAGSSTAPGDTAPSADAPVHPWRRQGGLIAACAFADSERGWVLSWHLCVSHRSSSSGCAGFAGRRAGAARCAGPRVRAGASAAAKAGNPGRLGARVVVLRRAAAPPLHICPDLQQHGLLTGGRKAPGWSVPFQPERLASERIVR